MAVGGGEAWVNWAFMLHQTLGLELEIVRRASELES
jgi:hypothetical protein